MTKHDLNRPALGKEPEAKKDEPEKSEAKPVRFRLGPLEIEGPLKVGVSILISLIVGAVSTLFIVIYYQQPWFLVEPMISEAITATAGASTPTASATPILLTIEGRICGYRSDFFNLAGQRVFLRSSEFNKLEKMGASIGTKVTVSTTIAGVTNSIPGLILDHDTKLSVCVISIQASTRTSLNPELNDDLTLEEGKRPNRRFEITVE